MTSSVMFGTAVPPHAKSPAKASPTLTGRAPATLREIAPQVKPFIPCDAATWLLAELDYNDVAFGIPDLALKTR